MLKNILLFFVIFVPGCARFSNTPDCQLHIIHSQTFEIATWVRQSQDGDDFIIYIEGDGNAFDKRGQQNRNPTPKSHFVRDLAMRDTHSNVAYVARPCQYTQDPLCGPKYWGSARFAPEIIDATADVVRQIAGQRSVTLVGFSGGAQVAGLIAVMRPDIHVKNLVTLSGNLDHKTWTEHHNLPPLTDSMDLADWRDAYNKIPAVHYLGANDSVIPPSITQDFVGNTNPVIVIPYAGHGW